MGIICGRRQKRDIGDGKTQIVDEVDIQFDVKSLKMAITPKDDCERICPMIRLPKKSCTIERCVKAYKR